MAALAVFAVSALHLGQLHTGEASWPMELVGHHASLPLALAILYQDYPFAFADLFLKRALALLAHRAIAFAAIATFGGCPTPSPGRSTAIPREVAGVATLWVATALLYPAPAPERPRGSWMRSCCGGLTTNPARVGRSSVGCNATTSRRSDVTCRSSRRP